MTKFFSKMKISKKLPLWMIGLAILNVMVTSSISGWLSVTDAVEAAEKKALAVTTSKKDALALYLGFIEKDLSVTSVNGYTKQAIIDFTDGWNLINSNPTKYLQRAYLPEGLDAAERINITKANDGSAYSEFHAEYHPFFKNMLEKHGYYDIFLFDTKGNLVYSVFKELDYATNMHSGQWKDTDLANAYKAALNNKEGGISFFDFKPYEPSYGAPASFISTPVFDNGTKIGVLVFQMPIDKINTVMGHIEGEEESVKHILVGEDGYYRNNPYQGEKENGDVILKMKLETDDYKKALETNANGHGKTDEIIYAYDVLKFNGTRFAIVTQVDKSEIMAPIMQSQYKVWFSTAVALAFIALISIWIARTLSTPLTRQVAVMGPLSEGNYTVDVPDQNRGDEIGDIARAVETFKQNGMKIKEMEAEAEMQKAEAEREKKEALAKLANDFDTRVGGVIRLLSDAAESMTASATQMQAASQQTAEISATVASAATEADSNVQTVAAASEELSASSSEIARQIDAVAKKSSAAAQDAQETSESVNELNTLADSIGEVIGTIKDIAEQTNLLALNATIEAARAGEAGKGFAVVADEVKKLANETAIKTEEIDDRVNKIQEAIRHSVIAMDKIISNVSEIDQATTTVASAVEEQNAATAEIGRNVIEASAGTQQVSQSIVQVQQNAAETGDSSSHVMKSAVELKQQSDILKGEVEKFLNEIRGG